MDLKEKILVALGLDKDEDVKLAFQAKTEDGTIIVSTAEELEAGVDVSVLTEDGTTIPLPAGTYKLDTGVSFRVAEEGIVEEVIESETEEKETPKEEVEAAEEDESPAEKADWAESYEHLKDRVNNLENAIHDIKEKLGEGESEEMAEEVVEPSKNPKTIKTTEVKEFSVEELKAENEKLKAELAEQPAESPVNTNKFSSNENPGLSKKQYNKLSKQERFLYNLNKY